jgi:tRNA threonylcarbamoyladenosine biosynthesis protein TsaE
MTEEKFVTSSPQQTVKIGRRMAECLRAGDIVGLVGSLGAGKTVITKGICEGLGVDDVVSSPTFNLINIYSGRIEVYHFDFYRLVDMAELQDIGYEEYFFSDKGLSVVEWSDRIPQIDSHISARVRIELISGTMREIYVTLPRNLKISDISP